MYCVFVFLKQKNLMWDKNRAFLETLQDRKEGSDLPHWAQQGRRSPCRRRPFAENIAKKSALRAARSPRTPLAIQPRTNGHRNRCSRGCSRGAGSRLPAHPALQKSVKQYLFKYSFSYNCAQIELNLILWPCFISQQIYFYVLSGTCKTACKSAITKPSVFPGAVTVSC